MGVLQQVLEPITSDIRCQVWGYRFNVVGGITPRRLVLSMTGARICTPWKDLWYVGTGEYNDALSGMPLKLNSYEFTALIQRVDKYVSFENRST